MGVCMGVCMGVHLLETDRDVMKSDSVCLCVCVSLFLCVCLCVATDRFFHFVLAYFGEGHNRCKDLVAR